MAASITSTAVTIDDPQTMEFTVPLVVSVRRQYDSYLDECSARVRKGGGIETGRQVSRIRVLSPATRYKHYVRARRRVSVTCCCVAVCCWTTLLLTVWLIAESGLINPVS